MSSEDGGTQLRIGDEGDVQVIRRVSRTGGDGAGEGSGRRAGSRRAASGDDGSVFDRLVLLVRNLPGFGKLLFRLIRDSRVSRFDRALFALTLGYLFVPTDVIPDWIPVLGGLDDILVVVLALDRLLHRTDEAVLREHWDGELEELYGLQDAVGWAMDRLPFWARRVLRGV